MSVLLHQLLMLVGRLDDSPGVDAPRQRFRQFLAEHVTDAGIARAFIEQCQRSPGGAQHRALQDLIIFLGRFLGFETAFGSYEPLAGILEYHGHWVSRHSLEVVVEIRTDQTQATDVRSVSRAMAALAATSHVSADSPGQLAAVPRPLGLCVLTPLYGGRARLERALTEGRPANRLRMVSSGSLLALADMARTNLTHEDVLQLFESSVVLDSVVDLLERSSAPNSSSQAPRFWFVTVVADSDTPHHIVESTIRKRRIFPLSSAKSHSLVQPGDWICICVPGTGVVGHAQVESVAQDSVASGDGPGRFTPVLHLQAMHMYPGAPVVPDFQTQLRVTAAHGLGDRTVAACLSITRDEFGRLTRVAS